MDAPKPTKTYASIREMLRATTGAALADELDRRLARKSLVDALLRSAFDDLPEGYELRVCVERGGCWVSLWRCPPRGDEEVDLGPEPATIDEMPEAIATAIITAKEA